MSANAQVPELERRMGSHRGDDELDPTRAFVRSKVKYYDERWRWMDWSGEDRRWNWSAGLGGPVWFAFRRMKVIAAVYLCWIAFAGFAFGLGVPVAWLLAAQCLLFLLTGYYGTYLYGRRFRNEMKRAFKLSKDEVERARILKQHGGASYRAAVGAVLTLPILVVATFWAAEEVLAQVENAVTLTLDPLEQSVAPAASSPALQDMMTEPLAEPEG